ncbi:MAG: hypothetical protein VB102_04030 [Paludibacter sp.]|nr:hypothetical protein [Paludibacter sp.]
MKQKIVIALLLFIATDIVAQKREFITVGFNAEIKNTENMKDNISFSYENQLTKHHGFEIGLSKRNSEHYFVGRLSDGTFNTFHVLENYLTMPCLYQFNSNILNISTGLSFDYFVGWKDITKFGETELTNYTTDPKFYVGWVIKLGKSIPLDTKFNLEPSVYFNPIFKYGDSYYGVSMKLKYQL